MHRALSHVILTALYNEDGLSEVEEGMAAASIDERLQTLVMGVVEASLPAWEEAAKNSLPSLASLESFDWRVDLKTSSSEIEQMAVPTLLLSLQVTNPPESEESPATREELNLELSAEALEAMLQGLGRIKDQLSAVAK